MSSLVPCPSCGRHVRATESACPFCDALVPLTGPSALPASRARRAVAFAATLSVAACTPASNDKPAPAPAPTTQPTTSATAVKVEPPPPTPVPPRPEPATTHGSGMSAPAPRYGLPPYLADDDFV